VPSGDRLGNPLLARTNFGQLQRRVTAGRGLLRFAHEHPAYYVVFDLLVGAAAELVISLPLFERRARLVRLLTGTRPQLTVTPQDLGLQ
jgi:ATP-dependent DNA ligase